MSLIRIVTGSETFQSGSSGLLAQVVKCNGVQTPNGKPMFISDAAKGATAGITQPTRSTFLPASRVGMSEMGNWFDGQFDVPEGVIIRLFGRRQDRSQAALRAGNGAAKRGVVYIRLREGAALRRLTLNTIDDNMTSNIPVVVEGRYDILSLREAGAAGVAITTEDLQLTKPDAVRGVLVHTEVAPMRAVADKAVIETVRVGDEAVTVTTRRKPRAVNLDG